ncbi:MAG: hypothetical protein P4M15_06925 [Alphaproteobacteria bacterium]|nr:hypothetical protein [Alphaproteobacteria bacterium]
MMGLLIDADNTAEYKQAQRDFTLANAEHAPMEENGHTHMISHATDKIARRPKGSVSRFQAWIFGGLAK